MKSRTSVDKHCELERTAKSRRRQRSALNDRIGSSAALAVVGVEGLGVKIISDRGVKREMNREMTGTHVKNAQKSLNVCED
jgi:hypothetical protein